MRYLSSPDVGCVTLTVTEAGYRRGRDGGPDLDDPDVAADLRLLRGGEQTGAARTAPGRLLQGIAARRDRRRGPARGRAVRQPGGQRRDRAEGRDGPGAGGRPRPRRLDRVRTCRSSPPRSTGSPPRRRRATSRWWPKLTGLDDAAPVVTEPFTEWVLAGDFPAGRPAWERAGARFVTDVRPFEQRKLWLLNGAHSLLAYAGPTRGHQTVAEAIADPVCRGWVDTWWDEAARHLALPADDIAALPRRPARPVRQPADPARARPDRDGRLAEAAHPGAAGRRRASGRAGTSRREASALSPAG